MLDSINGLAINSEIILEELRHGANEAHKGATRFDNQDFRDNPNQNRV